MNGEIRDHQTVGPVRIWLSWSIVFEFLISLIDRLRRLLEGEVNQKNLLPITNESPPLNSSFFQS